MSKSRGRRRRRGCRGARPVPLSSAQVERRLALAADAEARGEPREALDQLRRLPGRDGDFHVGRLVQLVELGEPAPTWVWNRWVTVQATRPLWSDVTAEEADLADFWHAVGIAYPHGFDAWMYGLPEQYRMHLVAEHDWIVREVLVHESGRLARFLAERAGPGLVARTDHLQDWAAAPMGGYRLALSEPGSVIVEDLGTGESRRLLDLGLAVCHDVGEHFLGRIAPIGDGPGEMFDWRPLPVDEPTAREVAAAPGAWLRTIERRARDRLLAPMFSYHEADLTSDAPEIAWVYGLLGESWEEWLPRRDGTCHLDDAIPFALDQLLEEAARDLTRLWTIAPLVRDLLLRPGVEAVIRSSYLGPDHARSWRALATVVDGLTAGRCLRWARSEAA